ncbi:glycosyltransferase family 4 protein [Methanoculleus chikugoensis]|uniref:glycosyltransferase family 4 protein n=1 Tax=Methanoculleus chikugoensis TaxID=118126 RepID=UPI0021170565|nr:glycosyltransferase family 4 protein [Methanoculleus chikugoensis]
MTKLDIEEDKTILLFVGNPTLRKGADLLPNIMKKLGDDYTLVMTSGLRGDVKRYGKNIRYAGKVDPDQLVNLYNFCDMFLFPTRSEGLALTVLEAMACGKSIITTDCASMPEVIRDGHNGFLCEMNNVDDYAEKVHYLAQDKNLQAAIGARNRKEIQRTYNLQNMAKQYIDEYSKYL